MGGVHGLGTVRGDVRIAYGRYRQLATVEGFGVYFNMLVMNPAAGSISIRASQKGRESLDSQ